MSEKLKSKIDHMPLLAGALLMLCMGSAWASSSALESVESILQKRAQATEDDKKRAAGLIQYGKKRPGGIQAIMAHKSRRGAGLR